MKSCIKKALQLAAVLSLAVFFILGILIVLVQAFGILTLNGALMSSTGTLKYASITASAVLGVCCFILSYWKS